MEATVYLYAAQTVNYKRQELYAVGLHCELPENLVTGWSAHPKEYKFGSIFTQMVEQFEALGVTDVVINVPEEIDAMRRCINAKNPDGVIKAIENASNLSPGLKEELKVVCDITAHSSIKFTGAKRSVDKKDFEADVRADAAADCGMAQFGQGNKAPTLIVEDLKAIKKKVSTLHPLMVDTFMVDIPTFKHDGVYFNGVGDNKARKPKKDEHTYDERKEASHVYFNGNNGRLRNYGMYSAQERFNVLLTEEHDDYLDKFVDFQRGLIQERLGYLTGSAIRLREGSGTGVNSRISMDDFTRVGVGAESDTYSNGGKRTDLSYVFDPPRLFFKVKNNYGMAYEYAKLAKEAIDGGLSERVNKINDDVVMTDVTDFFYQEVGGKVTMNPERNLKETKLALKGIGCIPLGSKEVKEINIPMLYQATVPTYQEFKRQIKDNPKVYIQTVAVETHVISYSLILKTDRGLLRYNSPCGGVAVLRKAAKMYR